MIKTLITIEFYKTHFEKSLLIQKSKQKKLKILKKNYSDDDSANHQTTGNSFENNDSNPQNISEIKEMPNNDESENTSNSIHIEKKKADLPISIKNNLKILKKTDLQTSRKNDLQTKKLPNLMKTPENRANKKGFQAAFDSAKKKFQNLKNIKR